MTINVESAFDRLFIIIIPLYQFSAGVGACIQFLLGGEIDIQQFASQRTGAPAGQAFQQNIEIDIHEDRSIKRLAKLIEQILEIQRLYFGARKAIQDKTFCRVGLRQSFADDAKHDVVGDQLAGLYDVLGLLAKP